MKCKTCPASDPALFYPYQLGECKNCTRSRVRANRDRRVDYYRAFDRLRGSDPARKAQYLAKQARKRAVMGPGYDAAHNAVRRALQVGALTKPERCERCPTTESVQAHHDDHTKKLDVMWLCPICHAARHKELGRLRTVAAIYGDDFDPLEIRK